MTVMKRRQKFEQVYMVYMINKFTLHCTTLFEQAL